MKNASLTYGRPDRRSKLCVNLPFGSGYTGALVAAGAYELEELSRSQVRSWTQGVYLQFVFSSGRASKRPESRKPVAAQRIRSGFVSTTCFTTRPESRIYQRGDDCVELCLLSWELPSCFPALLPKPSPNIPSRRKRRMQRSRRIIPPLRTRFCTTALLLTSRRAGTK